MKQDPCVSAQDLSAFRKHFQENKLSQVAQKAASKTDIDQICYNTDSAARMNHKFSIDIPTMSACAQNHSGRCWIFSALNLLREKVAKDLNIEEFELSQNYIAFYDHLEKANTFLQNILETALSPLSDRRVSKLFSEPVGDGGWWEYFVGLICKYGIVPKDAMPETHQSGNTDTMNMLINMQLRKDGLQLRTAVAEGRDSESLQALKKSMLERIYNVLAICLGTPPETFCFEYVDKDQAYHSCRDLTPMEFYNRFIGRKLTDIVSILNAPIDSVPFHTTCYTLGEESIYGTFQAKRLNLPMEEFKAAVLRQLEAGEPTWFVCDCDYYGSRQEGIWDTDLYDYQSLFSLDLELSKGDLLNLRQCSLNHAMIFTGVNLVDGKPDKWKIENSWGTDTADKGYFICSDAWFDRYVFTSSIDRKYLTEAQNRDFDQEPQVLEPWNVLA